MLDPAGPFHVSPNPSANSTQGANWWRFPYGVGRQLASLGIFDRKIKCALLMPVVDYAASFLAAGLLIGYAATRLNSESELAEHTNPAQSACAGRESNSP